MQVEPYLEDTGPIETGMIELAVTCPDSYAVVMGASGKVEREVVIEHMEADGIPVFKRRGGGGTVLLGPHVLVITVRAGVQQPFQNGSYFAAINRAMMHVMERWGVPNLAQRGLSDIATGTQKLVGSSIFRRKSLLLYQASLLVASEDGLMSRYLQHPPREPDYREGRDHASFVTSLRRLGVTMSMAELCHQLQTLLPHRLRTELDLVGG